MRRSILVAVVALIAVLALSSFSYAADLLIADFDSGNKPGNLGGDFGAWDKDPADFSQGCTDIFDPIEKVGDKGFSMKLDYDVDSPNPAYNGFWVKLSDLNATQYKNLSFDIKGDPEKGYTTVFKLEIKNSKGETGRFYATGVDDTWQTITIPLRNFSGIVDFSTLKELVVVFEDRMAPKKEGILYVDNIKFTN